MLQNTIFRSKILNSSSEVQDTQHTYIYAKKSWSTRFGKGELMQLLSKNISQTWSSSKIKTPLHSTTFKIIFHRSRVRTCYFSTSLHQHVSSKSLRKNPFHAEMKNETRREGENVKETESLVQVMCVILRSTHARMYWCGTRLVQIGNYRSL